MRGKAEAWKGERAVHTPSGRTGPVSRSRVTRMGFQTRDGWHVEVNTDRPCKHCASSSEGCSPGPDCGFSPSDGLLEHLGLVREEIATSQDRDRSGVQGLNRGGSAVPPPGPDRERQGHVSGGDR